MIVRVVDDVSLFVALATLADTFTRDKGGPGPEENTYGLPEGKRISAKLREWFAAQKAEVLGKIPATLTELPARMPSLAGFNASMAQAMTPVLTAYWDESGKQTRERLGLDPDEWRVTNPHTREKIEESALKFCAKTNATTSDQLESALGRLRRELVEGIVTEGETLRELTRRVTSVFDRAEQWRARLIAASEASRAVHSAQDQAARESGVVAGLELLLSSDACPLCRMIATECGRVRLGQAFAEIGSDPDYKDVRWPPLHPGCQCTAVEILLPEYGGPIDIQWGHTLIQPKPGEDYTPPAGKQVPKPQPGRKKPAVSPPVPPPPATPAPQLQPPPPPPPPPLPPPPVLAPNPKPKPKPAGTSKLGIGRLSTAGARLDAASKYIASRGFEVERNGSLMLELLVGQKDAANIPAAYMWNGNTRKILLNEGHRYWDDPEKYMLRNHSLGWMSSGDADHIVTHELAHALHDQKDRATFARVSAAKFDPSEKDLVRKHVSIYGSTKPAEFVAELYAGISAGNTYPPEVMDLYARFGGPTP